MSGKRKPSGGRRLRHDVVELLVDHHPDRSDFSRRPWRLYHADGRPFTPAEAARARTATAAEMSAAQQLALAAARNARRRSAEEQRRVELLASVMDGPDDPATVPELVNRLTGEEHEEAIRLFTERLPDPGTGRV